MNHIELSRYYLNLEKNLFTQEDINKLSKLLAYHSDLYYNQSSPIISDGEYDILFQKLKFLEEKFHIEIEQVQKVGSEVTQSTFEKVAHKRPMISLDNAFNSEDLENFDTRVKKLIGLPDYQKAVPYTLEYKFDGLGIELIYRDGKFSQAITRGNGFEGEDVTQNVKTISNIPKTIPFDGEIEIRGEIIMPISVFEEINKNALLNGEKVFSNPRNAASGSLRTLDTEITKQRKLQFFAYDIGDFDDFEKVFHEKLVSGGKQANYFEIILMLQKLGFEISSYFLECENIEKVIENITNFGERRKSLDFEIDGLVIKVNDISLWQDIGFTMHHPRYAIAYKFPAEISTTQIISVEHQVGKTGTITPVANLEEIEIGGVKVKRATLHNYEEVEKLSLHIGDFVFIKRAGEVIPKIISKVESESISSGEPILPPTHCPSCETLLQKDENRVRFYCPNIYRCQAQIIQKMIFSVGKSGLNIDGLGVAQIELFYSLGYIQNIADIYTLEKYKDEILKLEGYKQKSVENLFSSIEKSKNISIINLIVALNIPNIGPQTAKEFGSIFKNSDDILYFSSSIEELTQLKDIGEESAKNIIDYFSDPYNKEIIQKILPFLNIIFPKEITSGKYFEKNICITGSFEGYTREDLVKKLTEMGGKFTSSISKNTHFLLAGEKAGSKLQKAQSLGIEVLNLDDFLG